METTVHEVAEGIHRLSTYVEPADLVFNQYLVEAEQPLLFHCGLKQLFPSVSEALQHVMPLERLRWISFGHFEADECGSVNRWLAAAPQARVVFGSVGCMVSVGDDAIREPLPVEDGATVSLGDRELTYLATPHVPHGWDAGVLFDQRTRTLLCGDLFTAVGPQPAISEADPVGPAMEAEDRYRPTALTPSTEPTLRRLAALEPSALALMHGPCVTGMGGAALEALADEYGARFRAACA